MYKIYVFLFINSKLFFWVIYVGLKMVSIEVSIKFVDMGCV